MYEILKEFSTRLLTQQKTMSKIKYLKRKLANGLTVIIHRDTATAMASVNILYKVGARNEKFEHTGLAHLAEHLMFSGTEAVPNFDAAMQSAAAENNAFTCNDYTNYYIALPTVNIERALYVEADRMANLTVSSESLEVQRKVVVEEFAQRYKNQPYGDVWPILREMAYPEAHPYSWPTIGRYSEHIEKTTLEDINEFYERYYTPQNAILSIVSPEDEEKIFSLAEKWFAPIKPKHSDSLERDFSFFSYTNQRKEVERDVPASMIYICFPMQGRISRQAVALDVATDILSGGESSRLVQRLVKGEALFSSVNCYLTAEEGTGLLVATGRTMDGVSLQKAEEAILKELKTLATEEVTPQELEKVRNKYEANNYFSLINSLNKAMNLAYYEFLGDAEMINTAVSTHASISAKEVKETCLDIFQDSHRTTLYYNAR